MFYNQLNASINCDIRYSKESDKKMWSATPKLLGFLFISQRKTMSEIKQTLYKKLEVFFFSCNENSSQRTLDMNFSSVMQASRRIFCNWDFSKAIYEEFRNFYYTLKILTPA